jgi:cardiolipin synthase
VAEEPIVSGPEPTSDTTATERIRERVEERLRPLTFPNFLTLIRMAMVPFFVIAVFDRDLRLALWIFVLAGATDAVDGWIARRFNSQSVVGAYLDPIADKMLVTVAYVTLTFDVGQLWVIPLWLTILALFRDFLITLMAVILYVVEGIRRFPPSKLGRATTFMHVVTVSVVLIANGLWLPSWLPIACFYVSFGLVITSGFGYIYRSSKMIEETRQRAAEAREAISENSAPLRPSEPPVEPPLK